MKSKMQLMPRVTRRPTSRSIGSLMNSPRVNHRTSLMRGGLHVARCDSRVAVITGAMKGNRINTYETSGWRRSLSNRSVVPHLGCPSM